MAGILLILDVCIWKDFVECFMGGILLGLDVFIW